MTKTTSQKSVRVVLLATLLSAFAFASNANAQLAYFDFESVAVDGVDDGSLASLVQTNSGLTVTITRTSGINFDVINDDAWGAPNGYPSPGWGDQALSPFFAPGVPDAFLVNFSAPVDLFGVQAGDYGGDVDDLTLQAWSGLNGTGTLLDTDFDVYVNDFNMFGAGDGPTNLVVTGTGIQSVTFGGGGGGATNLHSVYWDNFRVSFTAIPEPSSLAFIGLGSLVLLSYRRRQA